MFASVNLPGHIQPKMSTHKTTIKPNSNPHPTCHDQESINRAREIWIGKLGDEMSEKDVVDRKPMDRIYFSVIILGYFLW